MLGHLIAFVLFFVIYGAFHAIAGHAMPLVPSLVMSVPCEVAGVVAGRSLRAWTRG
jgi:hypothetical protein